MLNKTKKIQALSKNRFHSLNEKEQILYLKKKNITRVRCVDCGRSKHIFETEKEAMLFIFYNGEQMLLETGNKPVRVYWCECCCGYHVTHREFYKKAGFTMAEA